MRSKLATVALAGALGITGVVGAALVAPALSYAATGDSTALDDHVASLKDALEGLVSDGTLTQSQADEVARPSPSGDRSATTAGALAPADPAAGTRSSPLLPRRSA